MNVCTIKGVLVKDPVYKEFSSGGSGVCSLRIANNRKVTCKDGSEKEQSCFINVRCFNRIGVTCKQFLTKGSTIIINGRLASREWDSKDGARRSEIYIEAGEIVFVNIKNENAIPGRGVPAQYNPHNYAMMPPNEETSCCMDDDIAF